MTQIESYKKSLRDKINHSLFSVIATSIILYFGAPVFIPLFIAIVIYFTLSDFLPKPSSSMLKRWTVSILATLTIALSFLSFLYAGSGPIYKIFQQTSTNLNKIERTLIFMREPIDQLSQAEEKVESLTESRSKNKPLKVSLEKQSFTGSALTFFQEFIADFFMTMIFLIFFFVYGDQFIVSFAHLTPFKYKGSSEKSILKELKKAASRYFITVTFINLCLGTLIGIALYCLGLNNALIWGILAGLLNFIPYIGCVAGSALVFIVALPQFDLGWPTYVAPCIYFIINSIEGQLITPVILGRTFCVNPLLIILTMGYLGFVGLFLAVPLLLIAKVIADNTYSFEPLASFMECRFDTK